MIKVLGHTRYIAELQHLERAPWARFVSAADFLVLQQLLIELFPDAASRPKIVGPDPHGWHDAPDPEGDPKLEFLRNFTAECQALGVELFAVTHHEYSAKHFSWSCPLSDPQT